MNAVLVLNADYSPLRVVPWQRAIGMLLDDKASLVQPYTDRMIRSASLSLPHPAVVALHRYSRFRSRVRFNRANVLARDHYTCQYCGLRPRRVSGRPDLTELTIDHVVPRAQARGGRVLTQGRWRPVTSWENVTTACVDCNVAKADQTPAEAGMALRHEPRVPTHLDVLWMALFSVDIPEEWREFLPANPTRSRCSASLPDLASQRSGIRPLASRDASTEDSPWRAYWTAELLAT